MQVEEVVRSAFVCLDSIDSVDDPRCLKAVQEIYAVVSALRANEIRRLSLEPALLTPDGLLIPSAVAALTSGATAPPQSPASPTFRPSAGAARSSSSAATSSSGNNSRSASALTNGSNSNNNAFAAAAGAPAIPPHLQSFAAGVVPPLSIKSLILLTARCYSGVAGVSNPSPTVEHVAQVALVVLRLCVTADAVLDPSEVQLLGEMALQLGAGRTTQHQTTGPVQQSRGSNNREPAHQARRGSSLSKASNTTASAAAAAAEQQQQQQHADAAAFAPPISSVSVLAAIELLLVSLYNQHIGGLAADATLGAASRHWLSAWLLRVEDGSAQPIEIFHRLCCFQRIAALRPLPASSVFAAQATHDRLIHFVCGEGGAVHASSVGLALHLLSQIVEHGPEKLMLHFVTPRLIELHIASWAASEWTETLEGAFVLLTAVTRLGLSPELWGSVVRANLHLACAHAVGSPSVRVAAAAATCLRTMLFLCQRELDIGLSVFFDAQAAPHVLRILDNGPENIASAAAKQQQHQHHHGSSTSKQQQQHLNQSTTSASASATTDVLGLRILNTECALAVAVFSSFSPAHRVAIHHVAAKYGFPLAIQRAHLALHDADLSIFLHWSLFDEAGRTTQPMQDPQFAALLSARPLSAPPPGTSVDEWRDAAFVKLSLIRSLQNPADSDLAGVAGCSNVHPRPALGSKELSLALLRHFAAQLQRIAATEGKGGAFPFSEVQHHANIAAAAAATGGNRLGPNNEVSFVVRQGDERDALNSSNINEAALAQSQFESCVNLILRFAKCAPLPKREALVVSRPPPRAPNSSVGGDIAWQLPPGSMIDGKKRKQQQVVLLTKQHHQQPSASVSGASATAAPSAAASGAAHGHNKKQQHQQLVRSASENSLLYHDKGDLLQHGRGTVTGTRSTVSSSSRPHNESGFRRTHLFSHPYVDYYMNAQHRNAYTPNPTIPPQVRRWSLDDVQRGDLFNFYVRLDGLDELVALHERESEERRESALRLHREGEELRGESGADDDDDDGEGEGESRHRGPADDLNATVELPAADASHKDDDEFSIDEDDTVAQHQQQQHRSATVNTTTGASTTRTPSVVPPPDAVAISAYLMGADHNDPDLLELQEHSPLQQRVTALVAEALRSAELHLLALNERAQCCPTKLVTRRAFLVDMINNVMPAIVSMLTMLFSVAKRAPAAIVRVTKRVERAAEIRSSGGEQQQQQPMLGAIAIHGGNICAVCHGLEMELLWN